LTNAAGKAIAISTAGKDMYALPADMPAGTYFLRWLGQTVAVSAGM
jgi:hypothetical protein